MSDIQPSLYQQQKKLKPRAEDVIQASLPPVHREQAMRFLAFLKSLRMTPQWASVHSWTVSYKGKRVCHIKVSAGAGTWYIRPSLQYDEALDAFCRKEQLTELMLKNVHHCVACGRCAPGKKAVFFGAALEHVCCAPIDFEFHNPDDEELNCVQKLVLYSRQRIAGD